MVSIYIKVIENQWGELNQKNKTPLHIAAENNSKEIAELLILEGADINIKDLFYPNLLFSILIVMFQK